MHTHTSHIFADDDEEFSSFPFLFGDDDDDFNGRRRRSLLVSQKQHQRRGKIQFRNAFFVLVVGIIIIVIKILPTKRRNRASVLSRERDEVTHGRVIVRYLRRRERADLSADTEPSGIVRESYFGCGFDRRDDVDVDDEKEIKDVVEVVTTGRGVRDEISESEFVQFETGFRRRR